MLLYILSFPLRIILGAFYISLASLVLAILVSVFRAFSDSLRDLPGPFWTRFSRVWYLKHVNKGHQDIDEVELHRKYGPIVRLAPGQYSLSDVTAAKTIYDHGSKFTKSDFYNPFGPPNVKLANIFQNRDIESHAEQRRKIASLYSMTSIVSHEPFVDSCIATCVKRFDQFADEAEAINVPAWMQYYAFDVISAITVGNPYDFLTHGNDFMGIIKEINMSQAFGAHMGAFNGSLNKYFAATMSKLGKEPPFQAVQRHAEESLKQKKLDIKNGLSLKETTGKQDFTEKLLALKQQGKVTDLDILATIRSSIAAGSDTTGISLAALIYYLQHHPSVLTKLRNEVDDHKSKSVDQSKPLSFTHTQAMPYLQATIKEAFRLHPAIGMQLPRVVPPGGTTLANRFFPAGTVVGINPWVIHRQPDLFGDDADTFRPERWLEDEQKTKEMDRCMFTFGAGSRVCIGKNISLLEIQKLIPELVSKYDFEFVDGLGKWESVNRFFVYTKYFCQVRRRKIGSA